MESNNNGVVILKKKGYNTVILVLLILFVMIIGGIIYYLLCEDEMVIIKNVGDESINFTRFSVSSFSKSDKLLIRSKHTSLKILQSRLSLALANVERATLPRKPR